MVRRSRLHVAFCRGPQSSGEIHRVPSAHSRQGDNKPYLDHPQFERFEVRQTVGAAKAEAGVTGTARSAGAALIAGSNRLILLGYFLTPCDRYQRPYQHAAQMSRL